jgi:hypothetical protein
MNRTAKLILFCILLAAAGLTVTVVLTIKHRRERAIFARRSVQPTFVYWYFPKYRYAFRCMDDPHFKHACDGCSIAFPDDFTFDLPQRSQSPAFDGPAFRCEYSQTLTSLPLPDPEDRYHWTEIIVCRHKPWNGLIDDAGQKLNCSPVDFKQTP